MHFFIITVFLCAIGFAQQNVNAILKSSLATENKIKLIDSLLNQDYENFTFHRNEILSYSYWLTEHKEYIKAIELTQKAINISKDNLVANTCFIQELNYKVAYLFYKKKDYKVAIKILQSSLLKKNNCEYTYKMNILAGICYRRLGDYHKALGFIKKTITIIEADTLNRNILENHKNFLKSAVNLSQIYNKIGGKDNIEKGREYLLKADSLVENHPLSYKAKCILNERLFDTYNLIETLDIKKGLYYLDKNLALAKKKKDSLTIFKVFMDKANLYNTTNLDRAIYYNNKAVNYIPEKNKKRIQYYYGNLAFCYLKKKEYDTSVMYVKKSIQCLIKINIEELLKKENHAIIYTIKDKQRLYRYLDYYCQAIIKNPVYKSDKEKLNEAIQYYYLIDELLDLIQLNNSEYKSRLHWRKKGTIFYSNAINVCWLANDMNSAFYFSEKNKAQVLYTDVLKNIKKIDLPKKVTDSELALKKEILQLTNQLAKEVNVSRQKELQNKLFDKKNTFQKFSDSLLVKYPEYYNNKVNVVIDPLSKVQEGLVEKDALLSYTWSLTDEGFDVLSGLVVTNQVVKFFKIDNVAALKELVQLYTKKVSAPLETVQEKQEFNAVSFKLYKKLFPSSEIRALLKNKRLFIAPDDQLQNIPFEALITDTKTNSYLIESSEVSYVYSMSFLEQNRNIKRNATRNFVGYSPENFKYTTLDPLTQTMNEIKTIQGSVGGDIYTKGEALKASFLNDSNQYKIIHLATHADASSNPWIAFNDSKLEGHELYTYKNEADLVVLSACNTGAGELAKGEGVMSLARGFFHSGANTVVSSLWSVNDKSTASIMESFYEKLSDGETKSKALHLAKRKYIATHSLSDTSPYYWAPFVLVGDPGVVPLESNTWYWWVILILFVVPLIFRFYKKKAFK